MTTKKIKFITKLKNVSGLTADDQNSLSDVADKFEFRANDYYLSLIDWSDPNDPIRKLIVPDPCELEDWGSLDPSGEKHYTIMPGLEHKYHSTALLLVSNVCGGICRYCFRKRVFIHKQEEILSDPDAACDYLREHPEISNVLLTGGDPLMLSTNKLHNIIEPLLNIDHIKIIRLGTKIPAFNPYRFLDDPELIELMQNIGSAGKQLYAIVHFNHANELTDPACQALRLIHNTGATLANQTPIIRGINDNPDDLADLFNKLSFIGVPPYYVFQCRPALGNKGYSVPIEEAYQIFEQAKAQCSGLAKRARYSMSHQTGKIEIVGLTQKHVYFKYHRAALDADSGKFMVFKRNPDAYWLDDYDQPVEQFSLEIFQNNEAVL